MTIPSDLTRAARSLALSGDVVGGLDLLKGAEGREAARERRYLRLLSCDFAPSADCDPDDVGAGIHVLAGAMRGEQLSVDVLETLGVAAPVEDRYFLAEAAMALGAIEWTVAWTEPERWSSPPDAVDALMLRQVRARALAFAGRLDDAAHEASALAAELEGSPWRSLTRVAHGIVAYTAALRGDRPGARAAALLALNGGSATAYLDVGARVLVAFAWLTLGQPERMEAHLLEAAGGEELPRLQWVDRAYGYEVLAAAALARGDQRDADRWVAHGAALLVDRPAPGMASAAVARAAGLVAHAVGDHGLAIAEARHATDAAGAGGGVVDSGRGRILHARAMAGSGSRSAAIAELEEVARAAGLQGAAALRADAVRGMRELGRRFRDDRGEAALTPREREIAGLVAAGLTNRQIAERLVVSDRTVDAHVGSILRLLDLNSRSELPRVWAPTQPPKRLPDLTARQRAVAELVSRGLSNRQIAAELAISEGAVERHLEGVFARWDVRTRTSVAALFLASDLAEAQVGRPLSV